MAHLHAIAHAVHVHACDPREERRLRPAGERVLRLAEGGDEVRDVEQGEEVDVEDREVVAQVVEHLRPRHLLGLGFDRSVAD